MIVTTLIACAPQQASQYDTDRTLSVLLEKPPTYPQANFVVLSDLHTYDPALGTDGKAFESYAASDYKLTKESAEILQTAIEQIKNENVDFVLIPGDLADHGDRSTHELIAKYLIQLEKSGKKVYVIPGNHDIENPIAVKFSGNSILRIRNISPDEFVQIYGEFGYQEALYRDPASLSYIAEPQQGLWLLALDSCRYQGKAGEQQSVTSGRFSLQTLQWIEEMLIKAAKENKPVIAMEHHPAIEHFSSQAKYFPEYVIENYQTVSKLLAEYNVRLVITGHFHAQDITVIRWPETKKFLFDIETGSLVTYPCPYRVINIDKSQNATIRSARIQSIQSHPQGFQDYAESQLEHGIMAISTAMIAGYGIDQTEAQRLAGQVAAATIAHLAGDEKLPAGQNAIQDSGLSLRAWAGVQLRKDLVESLWKDLPPPDNNVTLDLKTGD